MKNLFVNILAIVVIVLGLMAFSAPPSSTSLSSAAGQACCNSGPHSCCGDVCYADDDGCKAKDCSLWVKLFGDCTLDP